MALVCELAGGTRVRHRLLALGLFLVLVALVPLADVSPPDATWLTGIYDAGDFDEVVVAVVSATAVVTSILPPKPPDIHIGMVQLADAVLVATAAASKLRIRAPPLTLPHGSHV